jgi:hypothetical protein
MLQKTFYFIKNICDIKKNMQLKTTGNFLANILTYSKPVSI